ncbi:unnamed protein product [Spodoptera littoralis]|uniref:Uncharacterized protein n=1 Tax=Spodoptera littoralis TaxID=7109 RepID=A0A9P0IJ95_SPOLI|nr:unnamed protein product [Spodoptera littoralis]CAH1647736.1 unnamed protein product [Spodoptera littoralis]
MDDFFKNIRSTLVNVDNIIKEEPISENKIDHSKLLKDIEIKPKDHVNQLPKDDTRVNVNQQYVIIKQLKRNDLNVNENSGPCEGRLEADQKDKFSFKSMEVIGIVDKSNTKKDTKDEVKSFRSKIFETVMAKSSSFLEKVAASYNVLTKEEEAPIGKNVRVDDKPINYILGKVDKPIKQPEPLNAQELDEKLNEISLQSKAAIEDLKNQSIKIVDTARAQTDMVIENARYNFNMFSKSLEEVDHQQTLNISETVNVSEEEPVDETFDEIIEKCFGSRHVIDFLN